MLLGADPQYAKGRRISVEEVLENAASKVDAAFRDQPLVAASIRGTLGRVYFTLGRNDESEPHLRFAYETYLRLSGPEHKKTLEACHDLARTQHARHELAEAEALLRSELEYRERTNDPFVYVPMTPLAQVLNTKGDSAGAEDLYTRVIGLLRDREHLDSHASSSYMSATTDLANLVYLRGESDRALALYEEALEILQREHGELHPDVARVIGNRASLYDRLYRHEEALAGYGKALEIQEAVFRADHPDIATSLHSLALALKHVGRHAEAVSRTRQSLELRRKLFGEDAPETAFSQVLLADLLRGLDRFEEAEALLRQASEVLRKALGPDAVDLAEAQFELAMVLRSRKDFVGALGPCEDAVRIRRLQAAHNPGQLIQAESLLAQLHHSMKRYDLAEPVYRDVIERYRKLEGETRNVAIGYANLGQMLEDQGRLEDAAIELAKAVELARKVLDPADTMIGFLLTPRARIERKLGRLDEAAAMLEETLEIERAKLPAGHSAIASALCILGDVRVEQGRAAEAEPLLQEGVEARRKLLPEGDWQRASAESSLGRCLVALKRYGGGGAAAHGRLHGARGEEGGHDDAAGHGARARGALRGDERGGEGRGVDGPRGGMSRSRSQVRISSVQTRRVSRSATRTAWLFVSAT